MSLKYIRVVSDLHLEAFSGRNSETLAIDFVPSHENDPDAVLVLAGDISSHPDQLVGFINVLIPRFKKVLFVSGNHEYYRHDYNAWNLEMRDRFAKYSPDLIHSIGEVGEVVIEDVRFIFATLWGDGGVSQKDNFWVDNGLNDFRVIRNGEGRFKVESMILLHKYQKSQIAQKLNVAFDGKTVVVTHHLPSRRLVSARFIPREGGDGINGGFVGDCDNILAYDHAPNIWIHGHTHDTIDTMVWKTRIVCHPAGYRGEWQSQFNSYISNGVVNPKFIEL